ncbi:hypothetical protein, partial [Leptospira kirschneri]|uniref:hypothetical protein n=1 Tax=Leptospira kirschneri TaxID=29507 RepID=UPI0006ACBF53
SKISFYLEKWMWELLQNLKIATNTKMWELPLLENSFHFLMPNSRYLELVQKPQKILHNNSLEIFNKMK